MKKKNLTWEPDNGSHWDKWNITIIVALILVVVFSVIVYWQLIEQYNYGYEVGFYDGYEQGKNETGERSPVKMEFKGISLQKKVMSFPSAGLPSKCS